MMTAYGDLDVSRLTDKPPGRQPVDTRTVPLDRIDEVAGGGRPRAGARRQGVLGLPDGRGDPRTPISPPPRSATARWRSCCRAGSGWCTAA